MQPGRLAALSLRRRAGKGDTCLTGKLVEHIAQRASRDVIALAHTLDSGISCDTGNSPMPIVVDSNAARTALPSKG